MNKFFLNAALALSLGLFLSACDDDSEKEAKTSEGANGRAAVEQSATSQEVSARKESEESSPRKEYVPPPSGPYDSWVGMRWTGVEGTWLLLGKNDDGSYRIMNRMLDGYVEFTGKAGSKGIEFERNGKKETILAGDGKATGMKYLLEKTDCLVINEGEGYCRD